MPTLARARPQLIRLAAITADAAYLGAWWLAPAAAWAPWLIAAGLVLGGTRVLRQLRQPHERPWWAFCLPLLLPLSSWLPPAPAQPLRRASGAYAARRVGPAIALVVLFALCATGLAGERVVDPLLAPLDERAEAYVDRALLQAGGTYVGARAFERLLAVAGDISIGIGFIEGRPGQLFEPLRDLLDRFSTVVLVALASLTLQKVMLQLGGDFAVTLFGSGAIALLALSVIARRGRSGHALASAAGLLLGTAVVLRILLPLTGVGVAAVAQQALAERQQAATATVERAAQRVGLDLDLDRAASSGPPPSPAGETIGTRMGELKDRAQALQTVDEAWLDQLFEAFIDLVAVFVIETLVAPLLVLLLLWRLWRRLAAGWQPVSLNGPARANA